MFTRMDSRLAILIALISFSALPSTYAATAVGQFQDQPNSVQPTAPTAATVLSQSREFANDLNYEDSFALLSKTFPADQVASEHATQILDIMVSLIEAAKVEQDMEFADKAYGFARTFALTSGADRQLAGHGELENAYPFMQTINRLATAGLEVNEKISAELFVHAGRIARNLEVNPSFPTPAKPGIASSLFMEARGYALRGDMQMATNSLSQAYQWGFVDFHAAFEDPIFRDADSNGSLKAITQTAHANYKNQVQQRVRDALANFPQFHLDYSLQSSVPGSIITNKDFMDQIVVLDLGASWCAPCVQSIPHLKRLQSEYGKQGVKVLNASFENGETDEENRELLKKFIAKHEINYDVVIGTEELRGSIPNCQTFPGLVFVDRLGNVRYAASGYHDFTQISTIVELLLETESVRARIHPGHVQE